MNVIFHPMTNIFINDQFIIINQYYYRILWYRDNRLILLEKYNVSIVYMMNCYCDLSSNKIQFILRTPFFFIICNYVSLNKTSKIRAAIKAFLSLCD